jgi:hypothetical protein
MWPQLRYGAGRNRVPMFGRSLPAHGAVPP